MNHHSAQSNSKFLVTDSQRNGKIDIFDSGNLTSKVGCLKICKDKYQDAELPSTRDMIILSERFVDIGKDRKSWKSSIRSLVILSYKVSILCNRNIFKRSPSTIWFEKSGSQGMAWSRSWKNHKWNRYDSDEKFKERVEVYHRREWFEIHACMEIKQLIILKPLKGILILMRWSGRVEVILFRITHGYKSNHFIWIILFLMIELHSSEARFWEKIRLSYWRQYRACITSSYLWTLWEPNFDANYIFHDEPDYRHLFYFFSSNSCNFVHSSNRLKLDCPKEFVFCMRNDSKPVLVREKMTFQTALDYCANISSHICKLNHAIGFSQNQLEKHFFRHAKKFWRNCRCFQSK